ncbi:MAG: prepilin-type N-terminal cleavage/methylation domain-containing protein [Sedimentisphaerales bacterium]
MKSRKGFTLIELMVVILIVGILAAVAIPLMRGRIDSAKWSEGKSIMGTIGTAVRAYAAEKGNTGTYGADLPSMTDMGFALSDFTGTYFNAGNFSWTTAYSDAGDPPLTFTVTATAGAGIQTPSQITLDNTGAWVETP